MNVLFNLAMNQLRKNRSQTLLTIIGIILSVTLITSVLVFIHSFYVTLLDRSLTDTGRWHYAYSDVDASIKMEIDALPYVESTYPLISLQDGKTVGMDKPDYYVHFMGTDEIGFENLPLTITSGDVPKNDNEILVAEALLKLYPETFAIGKNLSFRLGELDSLQNTFTSTTSKFYRVVGTYSGKKGDSRISNVYTKTDLKVMSNTTKFSLYVIEKNTNKGMIQRAKDLSLIASDGETIYTPNINGEYLVLRGISINGTNIVALILLLTCFLLAIVIAGSIALIYNGFSMTASDMSRQLGLLGSIGATNAQKRLVLLLQGMILSFIGITLGLVVGLVAIFGMIQYLNHQVPDFVGQNGINFSMNGSIILIIIFISLMTVLLSALLPASRMARRSPIEALRQNHQIKISKKAYRMPSFVKSLGIEAELSYKTMKRFSKRYRATRFSIILSIVLFLSVLGYASLIRKSIDNYYLPSNYDLIISNYESTGYDRLFYQKIAKLDQVEAFSILRNANVAIKEAPYSENLRTLIPLIDIEPRQFNIVFLDDVSMKAYLQEINVEERILDNRPLAGILINSGNVYLPERKIFVKTDFLTIQNNESLTMVIEDYSQTNQDGSTPKVSHVNAVVASITDRYPIGLQSSGDGTATLVLRDRQEVWDTLAPEISSNATMFLKCEKPMLCESEVRKIYDQTPAGQLNIYNQLASTEQQNRMMRMLFLFLYIFIFIVALISAANVFNSISVSLFVRRKELAMLKSVGMTNRSQSKMLNFESLFYTSSAILISLPVAFIIQYILYTLMNKSRYVDFAFDFPYFSALLVIILLFVLVRLSMTFALKRLEKGNIIHQLKDETI